jgi:membrane fusion protein (multidrug efflux system)
VNPSALVVPQIGITHDQKGTPTALVVNKDDKVELRQLVTSATFGNNWVVDSGLNAGDRVIVNGVEKAKPGMQVKPVDAKFPYPASDAQAAQAPGASGAQGAAASAPANGSGASGAQAASAASGA